MTGRTSEVHHHCALVERHWVTIAVPVKNITELRRKRVIAEARELAAPRMAEVGLRPDVAEVWSRPGEVGVTWTVVVGEVHTVPAEREPFWVWTPRWRHWLSVMTKAFNDESGTRER